MSEPFSISMIEDILCGMILRSEDIFDCIILFMGYFLSKFYLI